MSEETLLKGAEICAMFNVHRSTLWRWFKSGILPMPLKVNGQNRWRSADIHSFIQERQAEVPERRARKKSKSEIAAHAAEPKKRRPTAIPESSEADHQIAALDLRLAGARKRRHRLDTPVITGNYFATPLSEEDREARVERGGSTIRWRL